MVSLVGLIDFVTPWSFSLFMFYAFAIFVVAWTLGLRHALPFAATCLLVSWFANVSSYPFGDLRGYAWSAANRSVAFLFVAVCGSAVRSYREEAHARVAALEHAPAAGTGDRADGGIRAPSNRPGFARWRLPEPFGDRLRDGDSQALPSPLARCRMRRARSTFNRCSGRPTSNSATSPARCLR